MNRRAWLALPLLLPGCGLAERPYAERRQWPLIARRPQRDAPRRGAPVLLVRGLRAGPGLDQRGLQTLQPDGSIRTAFYEEWVAPPAQAVEEAIREWMAESGLYSAVIAPGSRLEPDHVLEGELTGLWSIPATGQAHVALGVTVVAERPTTARVLIQQRLTAEVPLAGGSVREEVEAQSAALATVLSELEALLRRQLDTRPDGRRRPEGARS